MNGLFIFCNLYLDANSHRMNANEQLIHRFYSAFQIKDYQSMQDCYSDKVVFNDPVFINLEAREVKAMWEMFCKNGKDLVIEFSEIKADNNHGSAKWTAHYRFSSSGKKVVNHIHAAFRFEDGFIIHHEDDFDFYAWSCQALGITGKLLGKTNYLKNKVRNSARYNLQSFMNKV